LNSPEQFQTAFGLKSGCLKKYLSTATSHLQEPCCKC